jgi:hypothetical protein
MKRYTSYADRQEIVLLHKQGHSYRAIAQQTGWSFEVVRKICRAYEHHQETALQPIKLGRPASGILSTFDPKVRFACLRIKRQHPRWGPDVVLAELATRSWAIRKELPSASRIGAYYSQFGDRLVKVRSHKQLPQDSPLEPALRCAHGCWQMDMDERVELPGYGLVNILNLVDYATGIKIRASIFPAHHENGRRCRVSWPQMQFALRQAFIQWGLPKRIRTDRDRVIVAEGDYPFPKFFTLWLIGLGIEHEFIRRVIENGCVERAHQTWEGRLDGYGPASELEYWQHLSDYELWRMNAILPSRGRNCRRRPPLMVYPEARIPLRWYHFEDEPAIFDIQRVHQYLTHGKWLRHTSSKGQFSLNNQKFNVGVKFKRRWVQINFDLELGFQVACPPDKTVIKTIEVVDLSTADITGLTYEV